MPQMETLLYNMRMFAAMQIRDLLAAERKGRHSFSGKVKDIVEAGVRATVL
jgi:hypothetical protein